MSDEAILRTIMDDLRAIRGLLEKIYSGEMGTKKQKNWDTTINPLPKPVDGLYEVREYVDGKEWGETFYYKQRVLFVLPYKKKEEFMERTKTDIKDTDGKWEMMFVPHKYNKDTFFWILHSDSEKKLKEIAKFVIDELGGDLIPEPSD